MAKAELLLKTALCCMASDGSIAPEELEILQKTILTNSVFDSIDAETLLQDYSRSLMLEGMAFVNKYLAEVADNNLNDDDAIELIEVAFKTIEADNEIQYSEVFFFKKIRAFLSISDDAILAKWPDKGDFLLPDIMDKMPLEINFSGINFNEMLN